MLLEVQLQGTPLTLPITRRAMLTVAHPLESRLLHTGVGADPRMQTCMLIMSALLHGMIMCVATGLMEHASAGGFPLGCIEGLRTKLNSLDFSGTTQECRHVPLACEAP